MADEQDLQTPAESPQDAAEQEPVAQDAAPDEAAEAATPPEEPAAEADAAAEPEAEAEAADPEAEPPAEGADEDMLAALKDLPEEAQEDAIDDINFSQTSVSKAEFQQLSEPAGEPQGRNIELLMDVNLPVSIELGRTKMSISDILALGPGSVVELNKLAGEPVDLLVNQKVVARGEVVVIDENFGVRVTQLMTAEERLKSLGEES
jgi:flagellar motor switch protein FliN/FliY